MIGDVERRSRSIIRTVGAQLPRTQSKQLEFTEALAKERRPASRLAEYRGKSLEAPVMLLPLGEVIWTTPMESGESSINGNRV
jgi:hypothetical protein